MRRFMLFLGSIAVFLHQQIRQLLQNNTPIDKLRTVQVNLFDLLIQYLMTVDWKRDVEIGTLANYMLLKLGRHFSEEAHTIYNYSLVALCQTLI